MVSVVKLAVEGACLLAAPCGVHPSISSMGQDNSVRLFKEYPSQQANRARVH